MKIKKWLILTYIVIMILPLINLIVVYESTEAFSKKILIKDYVNTNNLIIKYEKVLNDQDLYINTPDEFHIIKASDKPVISITLYNKSGIVFYSTENTSFGQRVDYNELYKNIGEIKESLNDFTFKRQVLDKGGNILGFYKIVVLRKEVSRNTKYVTTLGVVVFLLSFLLVLFFAIKLLNKKLNKPLKILMEDMTAYGKGSSLNLYNYNEKDEIGELISHFEAMKEKLNKYNEEIEKTRKSKEYMIAAISHDLKSPLTSIRAYAESLSSSEDMPSPKRIDYANVIINKSDFMYTMIEDLLTYTLLSSDVKMDFVEVDGEEFFEMLFNGYNELCEKNGIKLNVNIDVSGMYKVDVKYMMRCIDNLIANAIRYSTKGNFIYIGAISSKGILPSWVDEEYRKDLFKLKEGGALIIVKNTGMGINKDDINKITEPFYQVDTSRNKNKKHGSGLGLSIAKMIIENHSGTLKIFSDGKDNVIVALLIPDA